MSKRRRSTRAIHQRVLHQGLKLLGFLWRQFTYLCLKVLMLPGQRRPRNAGFVLPTAVALILVSTLTVGALLSRSVNRANQVSSQSADRVIFNAASPAIDRAKAKLEYLFGQDARFPNGIPAEAFLTCMMANGSNPDTDPTTNPCVNLVTLDPDPYTFPDETRLDLNGDGILDNAWCFEPQPGGNGGLCDADSVVAYSVLWQTPGPNEPTLPTLSDTQKADLQYARTGPLSTIEQTVACTNQNADTNALEAGWFPINTATLRKNFQIDSFVLDRSGGLGQVLATLELTQERQLDRGNRWGAWFRNDLEVFAGPQFNWNGAMHTEGSFIIGGNGTFRSHLISAPSSCVFDPVASEMTMTQLQDGGNIVFQGQLINGTIRDQNFNGSAEIHQNDNPPVTAGADVVLNETTDSVAPGTLTPGDLALDPILLFTQDQSRARNAGDPTNTTLRVPNWQNTSPFSVRQRVRNLAQNQPYVDDTYRADNLYGPPPSYGREVNTANPELLLPPGGQIGDPIPVSNQILVSNDPLEGNREELGFDGYWERRARQDGLRIIVGQRLNLGDLGAVQAGVPDGTLGAHLNTPTSPLPTPRTNEALQRQALNDNLAAVQGTAIYYYKARGEALDPSINDPLVDIFTPHDGGYEPYACLASTFHPGTPQTIANSTSFNYYTGLAGLNNFYSDFFNGIGTDGWEYAPPRPSDFSPGSEMMQALQNLVAFASDSDTHTVAGIQVSDGAFPAFQETSGTAIHPNATEVRFGDFSNLQRTLAFMSAGTPYAGLSIADRSNLHTAGCALGMLADNVRRLESVDITTPAFKTNVLVPLNAALGALSDGNNSNGEVTVSGGLATVFRANGSGPVVGPVDPNAYIEALYTNTQTLRADIDVQKWARFLATQQQVIHDRNPGAYTYPSLFTTDPDLANIGTKLRPNAVKYPALTAIFPSDTANPGFVNINNTTIAQVAPRTSTTDFVTPVATTPTTPIGANPIIDPNGNTRFLGFLDKALFNGREEMNVRVMDLDLDLLRQSAIGGDTWLPMSGVVYAFREDTVREDGVARPAANTFANCTTVAQILSANCRMVTNPAAPQDPPVDPANGISPKPVDFFADPDRRPYGFRLRNGVDQRRVGIPEDRNIRGLTLVTDNPVYIQGDFNFHRTTGGATLLEEYTTLLADDWSNFYTRTADNRDDRFAVPTLDIWRPTEILSDAVTILGNNFCDGSIQDYFTTAGTGTGATVDNNPRVYAAPCANSDTLRTSYLNANRPRRNPTTETPQLNWQRQNPFDPNSPIVVNVNGQPGLVNRAVGTTTLYADNGDGTTGYFSFTAADGHSRQNAENARVNAIIVSGLTPSRRGSPYGGMHNFPRFLENWGTLRIAGSFLQLNFATSATAPFDQDQWEPDGTQVNGEFIRYYGPPVRRWGYDVALQLAPAGPIARRFVAVSNVRSEYFNELSAEDPYIFNLRCAVDAGGTQVDTTLACP